jgi:predicted Rossmann fold flavoprotein
MSHTNPDVVIVGGGGAGLLAAASSAAQGITTTLYERNRRPGIKIRISGGGKCNVTHDGPIDDLLAGFPQREARFLKHALHAFSNADLRALLHRFGVETVSRENGRVFPSSMKADDVLQALVAYVNSSGARILTGEHVERVEIADGLVTGIISSNGRIPAGAVVVTTGGGSYAKTGTTGDGFRWARETGHTLVPVKAALAPIHVAPVPPKAWMGVALREGELTARAGQRAITSWKGDLLFTHEGVSGPAALETSRAIAHNDGAGKITLSYDFFPAEDETTVDRKLVDLVNREQGKRISTLIDRFLPEAIVDSVLSEAHIPADRRGYALTRTERHALAHVLKNWTVGAVDRIDPDRGEVTAGGVALNEINPRSMESKLVRGLFFAGEVLDVAGRVGGYNLQAAFSTGHVAGLHAARFVSELNRKAP